MFASICNFPLSVNEKKYVISVGYDLPDDVPLEEIQETPRFCFVIGQEVEEGKVVTVNEVPEDAPEEEKVVFKQLVSTAQVYTKGFVDGVSYVSTMIHQNAEQPANESKSEIIVE